ncbi:hypothetical protein EHM82_02880, partial [bacterium]
MAASEPGTSERRAPRLDDFLGEPTRDIFDWRWLWEGDRAFPIRSHRGVLGRILVAVKRLLRPLVKLPQNDLWERQRIFNLILLEHLQRIDAAREIHQRRIEYLESLESEGIREIMRHNDALFARVDQKLDRHRREARDLLGSLGAALAVVRQGAEPAEAVETIARAHEEHGYFELERRHRGTEEEIR